MVGEDVQFVGLCLVVDEGKGRQRRAGHPHRERDEQAPLDAEAREVVVRL